MSALALDGNTRRVTLEISLTAHEFSILRELMKRPGRFISREQLIERTKGNVANAFDRSIDVYSSRLRKELGDDSKRSRLGDHHPRRRRVALDAGASSFNLLRNLDKFPPKKRDHEGALSIVPGRGFMKH